MGLATAGLILGYIALAINLMGLPLLIDMIKSDRERVRRLAVERKEMTSDDGKIRVMVPGDWVKLPQLHDAAPIRVGNKEKEQYLIVLTDAKSELQNMTLEKHDQTTRDGMLEKMKDASASAPVSLTIGDHPAIQDELSGTKDGTDVVFLHTTVDTGEHYHQILAWTLKSRWEQNKELLREVTRTFHGKGKRHLDRFNRGLRG